LEVRERFNFPPSIVQKSLQDLYAHPEIRGAVILSTCNRTEIYAVTTEIEAGMAVIKEFMSRRAKMEQRELAQYLYMHTLYNAVRHLYRVAAGLTSMILGETQIIGQVADAYEAANQAEVTHKVINVVFQNSLSVGKRVRAETGIDQHPVSISYTAVELAKQCYEDLYGKRVLILGAGEMSTLTAKYLVEAGASMVMVSNRSFDRACALAQEFNGEAVRFEELEYRLPLADIVISATSAPHYILQPRLMKKVMAQKEDKTLLLIDIAVPRDINPAVRKILGVTLFDIDDLQKVLDKHQHLREIAAQQAESIIAEEMTQFMKWHNSLSVVPTIAALQQKGQEIKEHQLNRALDHLGSLTPKQEKIVRSLANSILNQVLHTPITRLKDAAETSQGHMYAEILQNLFDLETQPADHLQTSRRGTAE
jgi:glutamyl-tRNA reductase